MKNTVIMVSVIAVALLTWNLFGLIGYCLSDLGYKECMTHGGTLMLMMLCGWIPSVVVGMDIDSKY